MVLIFWLVALFVIGTVVGSFLNVCIYRIPFEKSVVWPGSHCGRCFQAIRWYDNIPLISYVLLRGRCRTCKARFTARYLLVELLTGVCFAGLFYLVVLENVHRLPALQNQREDIALRVFPSAIAWIVFLHHAVLTCFLIVASFCDLEHHEIPLAITLTGTVVGLMGAVLWPWPWPNPVAAAVMPAELPWWLVDPKIGPVAGLYPWPVWGPLPHWLPAGSWQLGLATGLAGMLAGTLMLRAVRYLFSTGLGVEALGMGDADLMMMAGSFLGWQPMAVAFLLAAFPGLVFALLHHVWQWLARKSRFATVVQLVPTDGLTTFRVDGQSVAPDQLSAVLSGLVKEKSKTRLLIDTTELDEWVFQKVDAIEGAARSAGITRMQVFDKGVPAGLLRELLRLLRWVFAMPAPRPVLLRVVQKNGQLSFLLEGQPVATDQLKTALAGVVRAKTHIELLIDASGLDECVAREVAGLREAAQQAGMETAKPLHRGIPFGPALAVGLMITLLGWPVLTPFLQPVFFWDTMLLVLVVAGGLFMFGGSFVFRLLRRGRAAVPEGTHAEPGHR